MNGYVHIPKAYETNGQEEVNRQVYHALQDTGNLVALMHGGKPGDEVTLDMGELPVTRDGDMTSGPLRALDEVREMLDRVAIPYRVRRLDLHVKPHTNQRCNGGSSFML